MRRIRNSGGTKLFDAPKRGEVRDGGRTLDDTGITKAGLVVHVYSLIRRSKAAVERAIAP